MIQPKDKDRLNGYKNKTFIYAVYKKPTSNQGTHTDWEGLKKDILCKPRPEEIRSRNTQIKDAWIKTAIREKNKDTT